ncbi:hypothetical protein CDD83_6166 [Cordyceps sp. RAO-2017]|nr:hypothetical protein CDD83_6166 [Cordyceps sp. RAO-2017]
MDQTTPLLAEGGEEGRRLLDDGLSPPPAELGGSGGLDNPRLWSASFKWAIVTLLAFTSFTVTFSCISVAPLADGIVDDLDGGRGAKSSAVLLVTIWELGEAAGPVLIAPLSEMFGRYPLFNLSNALFILATVLAALSRSSALFIAARALTGMTVAANVLNPAVVGDMFPPEQRGAATSFLMLAPLVGSSLGPTFSSAVAHRLGWRAVVWTSAALAGLSELVFFTYFRETYIVAILRRAGGGPALRKEAGLDLAAARPPSLRTCMMRPAVVFFGSGVLAAMSLFGAVIFAYLYVVSVSLPTILTDRYGFEPAMTGSAFLANGLGTLIGVVICKMCLDSIYVRLSAANKGVGQPEYRLPLIIVGVFTLPPAVALYGWCAEHRLPLSLFLLSAVWIRASMTLAFLPLMPYVVDACGLYSASALTGVIVTRCLAGAFLPLLTTWLTESLGYGWGFTLLGAFSFVVGIIPMLILRYGSRWRQRSEYTKTVL